MYKLIVILMFGLLSVGCAAVNERSIKYKYNEFVDTKLQNCKKSVRYLNYLNGFFQLEDAQRDTLVDEMENIIYEGMGVGGILDEPCNAEEYKIMTRTAVIIGLWRKKQNNTDYFKKETPEDLSVIKKGHYETLKIISIIVDKMFDGTQKRPFKSVENEIFGEIQKYYNLELDKLRKIPVVERIDYLVAEILSYMGFTQIAQPKSGGGVLEKLKTEQTFIAELKRQIDNLKDDESSQSIIPQSDHQSFLDTFTDDGIKHFTEENKSNASTLVSVDNYFSSALRKADFFPGYPPTPKQAEVIKNIVTSEKQVIVVEGVPGSGKTSGVLKWVVGFIRGVPLPKNSVEGSPKIYISAPNEGGMSAVRGDFGDENTKNQVEILDFTKLTTNDDLVVGALVIVDECYMMTKPQLDALTRTALLKNWRLILSGDPLQNLPGDNIFGLLKDFQTFNLNQSFRASRDKEQKFATIVQEAWENPKQKSKAIEKGLTYLLDTTKDQLTKMGEMKEYVVEYRNIFVGLKVDQKSDAHIQAVANWVKANLDDLENTLVVVHQDDKQLVLNALENITEEELGSANVVRYQIQEVVKTSAESQGVSKAQVVVILNKKMTQSEIYVALTRHKKDMLIIVPVSDTDKSPYFKNIDHAVKYRYRSEQIFTTALGKFKTAVTRIAGMTGPEREYLKNHSIETVSDAS